MRRQSTIFAALVAVASLVAQNAFAADYFYSYMGSNYTFSNNPFKPNMKLFGVLHFSKALPPMPQIILSNNPIPSASTME